MENIHLVINRIVELCEPTFLKVVVSVILAVMGFLFSSLYLHGLVAVVMLMIIDTILGVIASYREGKVITSKRFSQSIFKAMVYLTAISAGHFVDYTIPFNFIEATMIGFIGTTEFVSILENMGRMGFATPNKLLNQLTNKY